ncbi:hypothetical protein H4R35_003312 [Dimargaris xerosporica]|nr:hypothetical protein H4R35_003312 [Dimargaris xerosporica]
MSPFCVHLRMAITPIAGRINTPSDYNELIVVLFDAMTCHYKLYNDCQVLHRDISTNNIMVVRQNGKLQGMLVDFDHAIHIDSQALLHQSKRVGTLPYMSIGNPQGNYSKRTALDDWESLLYLICWLSTWGLKGDKSSSSPLHEFVPKAVIRSNRDYEIIARFKQHLLNEESSFSSVFRYSLDEPGAMSLALLGKKLHKALFLHPGCKGTFVMDKDLAEQRGLTANIGEKYDPWKARIDNEQVIVDSCLKILQDAAEVARAELSKPLS